LVSEIAANDVVRSTLLSIQRSIINNAVLGIVVEGRDIGTTVWPDAELKIFLTADVSARAQRRRAELVGEFTAKEVQQSLANRDRIDSTRAVSPLRQSEDQIQIDATTMSLEEVVNALSELIRERKLDQSGS
jgi:cytidylate kinase